MFGGYILIKAQVSTFRVIFIDPINFSVWFENLLVKTILFGYNTFLLLLMIDNLEMPPPPPKNGPFKMP